MTVGGRHPAIIALGIFAFAFPMGLAIWRLSSTASRYQEGHLSVEAARAGLCRGLGWLCWAVTAEALFVDRVAVPVLFGVVGMIWFEAGRWQGRKAKRTVFEQR